MALTGMLLKLTPSLPESLRRLDGRKLADKLQTVLDKTAESATSTATNMTKLRGTVVQMVGNIGQRFEDDRIARVQSDAARDAGMTALREIEHEVSRDRFAFGRKSRRKSRSQPGRAGYVARPVDRRRPRGAGARLKPGARSESTRSWNSLTRLIFTASSGKRDTTLPMMS